MDNREMLITALKHMQVEAIREISLNPEKKAEVLKSFQIGFSKMVSSTYIFFASMIEAPEEFLYDGLLVATKLADSFGIQSVDDSKAQVRRLAMALEHYAEAYEEPVMNDWMVQHINVYKAEHKRAMDSLTAKISKVMEEKELTVDDVIKHVDTFKKVKLPPDNPIDLNNDDIP